MSTIVRGKVLSKAGTPVETSLSIRAFYTRYKMHVLMIAGVIAAILFVSFVAWVWTYLWTNALRVWALQRHLRTLQARLAMRYLRRPQTDIAW